MKCYICNRETENVVIIGEVEHSLCEKCRKDVEKFSALCKAYIAAEKGA